MLCGCLFVSSLSWLGERAEFTPRKKVGSFHVSLHFLSMIVAIGAQGAPNGRNINITHSTVGLSWATTPLVAAYFSSKHDVGLWGQKKNINLTQRERTIWTMWLMGGSDNLASEIIQSQWSPFDKSHHDRNQFGLICLDTHFNKKWRGSNTHLHIAGLYKTEVHQGDLVM